MSTQNYYQDLDLNKFQILAKRWATKFPIIERVYLYHGVDTEYLLYVVLKKVFHAELKKSKTGCDKTFLQYKEYERECIDGSYLFKELPSVYKRSTPDWFADWAILCPWESEPEGQDRLVVEASKKVLFEDTDNLKQKKLRPGQKHKEQVRKVAEELWGKDPTMIYSDIYKHKEMQKLLKSFNRRKLYVEKTIKDWIKDLNPDRSPGRRTDRPPKTSPAVNNRKQTVKKYEFKGHTVTKIVSNK
jgi:hypothetical protein